MCKLICQRPWENTEKMAGLIWMLLACIAALEMFLTKAAARRKGFWGKV